MTSRDDQSFEERWKKRKEWEAKHGHLVEGLGNNGKPEYWTKDYETGKYTYWHVDEYGNPTTPKSRLEGPVTFLLYLVIAAVAVIALVSALPPTMTVAAVTLIVCVLLAIGVPWIGVPLLIIVVIGMVLTVAR